VGINCEVIVVDNASTDRTAEIARQCWPANHRFPLRVVLEAKKGLSNARSRGLAEANYEFVSFVDDDNWVCADWIQISYEILAEHSDVAACGGPVEPAFEISPPSWYKTYQGNFAVGPQHQTFGYISKGVLWGAGLTLRKSAWNQLTDSGFQFSLTGRSGTGLTCGEDCELCYALVLAGWKLWYDPRLQLQHFMPAARINWQYLRRLLRGAGWSETWLDAYREALEQKVPENALWSAANVAFLLARNPIRLLSCMISSGEGKPAIAAYELMMGRLTALIGHRSALNELRVRLRNLKSASANRPEANEILCLKPTSSELPIRSEL